MARKKKHKSVSTRKPSWQARIERVLSVLKKLLVPFLVLWVVGWLWLGGVFDMGRAMMIDSVVAWTADQGLVVQDVVITGRNRTNLKDLQKAIQVEKGDALLAINMSAMHNRIEALDWVQKAQIARSYTGIVTVTLSERIPFVIWDRPGRGKAVVDTNGKPIQSARLKDFQNLLIVKGVDAPNNAPLLLSLLTAEPSVANHIKAAEWIGGRRWDLISDHGVRIHLPETDMGFALSRLAKALQDKNLLQQNLKSIDLRVEDRIIIETPRGKAQSI